jgi:hypothetical protein
MKTAPDQCTAAPVTTQHLSLVLAVTTQHLSLVLASLLQTNAQQLQ